MTLVAVAFSLQDSLHEKSGTLSPLGPVTFLSFLIFFFSSRELMRSEGQAWISWSEILAPVAGPQKMSCLPPLCLGNLK